MGKDGKKAKSGTPPTTSKAKKGVRTPRDQKACREEGFFDFDWTQLRPVVTRSFLLAVCDQEGWDYEVLAVLSMDDDEVLSEVQAFSDAVKINFNWAADIQTWLELGDHKDVMLAGEDDMAQLKEIMEYFERKEEARKKALRTASPNSRAKQVSKRVHVGSRAR